MSFSIARRLMKTQAQQYQEAFVKQQLHLLERPNRSYLFNIHRHSTGNHPLKDNPAIYPRCFHKHRLRLLSPANFQALQVAHLNEGDSFEFTLSVEDAYGPYEEEHVIEVPKQTFVVNGRFDNETIYPGAVLPLVNEEGFRFDGLVLEVKEEVVVLDLNHPLAGKELHYSGVVVTAREATNEEIQGTLNMMAGEGCGCGCGGHHHHEGECGCGDHHHHEGECACGGH